MNSRLDVVPLDIRVEHPELGLLGCIVINASVWRGGVGGMRMSPGVTRDQVADLAEAMTYKFGFLDMPFGGAKGGIVASDSWFPERKWEVLEYFGSAIGPLVRNRVYSPGQDLGVGPREYACLLAGAGIGRMEDVAGIAPHTAEQAGFPTGLTVFLAAEAAFESLGRSLTGATIAIEGMGKVGGAAVRLFSEARAKIVAVSTLSGALYDREGLDPLELLRLSAEFGDDVVWRYSGGTVLPREDIFWLDVDILCPCAAQWSIRADNAHQLQCRVLCPGANCPIAPDLRERLSADPDILVIPDFVANCGSVLDGNLQGGSGVNTRLIRELYGKSLKELMLKSRERGVSPTQLAREIAVNNIRRAQSDPNKARRREDALHRANTISDHPWVPGRASDYLARRFGRAWMSGVVRPA